MTGEERQLVRTLRDQAVRAQARGGIRLTPEDREIIAMERDLEGDLGNARREIGNLKRIVTASKGREKRFRHEIKTLKAQLRAMESRAVRAEKGIET